MRYFSKRVPQTPIWLKSGKALKFDSNDSRIGFFATADIDIVAELEAAIAGQRGGVTEVTEKEYDDFLKKKGSSPRSGPKYREEIRGTVSDTITPRVKSVPPVVVEVGEPEPASIPVRPESDGRPKAGKRS